MLDFWESGMDIQRSGDMFECLISYQDMIQKECRAMQALYGFETVNGTRSIRTISQDLKAKIEFILRPQPSQAREGVTYL